MISSQFKHLAYKNAPYPHNSSPNYLPQCFLWQFSSFSLYIEQRTVWNTRGPFLVMFSFMKYQVFVPKTPNIFAIIPGPPSTTVHTANTYSGKTVEVQWNHCTFEKIQWFTTDHASLYFLPVKKCNFNIVLHVIWFYIEFNVNITSFHCFQEYSKKM